ncbi:hypothetical protein IJS77_00815 [bacterium]|nr:hypothetical protein [bacterium]
MSKDTVKKILKIILITILSLIGLIGYLAAYFFVGICACIWILDAKSILPFIISFLIWGFVSIIPLMIILFINKKLIRKYEKEAEECQNT